jgi:hypothetical protein
MLILPSFKKLGQGLFSLVNHPIILYGIIAGLLYLLVATEVKHDRVVNVLNHNYESVMSQHAIEQELTASQFVKYYHRYDSLAESLKIQPKTIQQVTVTKYVYQDKISVHDSIHYIYTKDTVPNELKFIASKNCFSVSGTVIKDSVKISDIKVSDNITTFLYCAYDHKFLFFKWGKYYTAKVYSACMNDTLSVTNNIKIVKKLTD